MYPPVIQDLSSECPVVISGRFKGKLSESLKLYGKLADMSNFVADLKVWKAEDILVDKVCLFLIILALFILAPWASAEIFVAWN